MAITTTFSLTDIRTEFGANSNIGGAQSLGNVVGLANGGYAVAYATENGANDFPLLDIYDSPSDTMPINVTPFDESNVDLRGEPVITRLASGNLAVVWKEGAGGDNAVLASIVDPVSGAVLTREAAIPVDGTYVDPEVAALTNGNFVVVANNATNSFGFLCTPAGVAFDNFGVEAGATDLAVSGLTGGRIAVAYVDGGDVNARIFEANGTPVAGVGEITVGSGGATSPQIVALGGDAFAAVYDDASLDGTPGIFMHIYGSDGTDFGGVRVDVNLASEESDPEITQLRDGVIAVTWTHAFNATDSDVYGRVFDFGGGPLLVDGVNAFLVDGSGNDQTQSSVAGIVSGQFVTAWTDEQGDGSGDRISACVRELVKTITGDGSDNILDGGALRDSMHGGGGADGLRAYEGRDELFGDAGNDRLQVVVGDLQSGETYDGGADFDQLQIFGAGSSVFDFRVAQIAGLEQLYFANGTGGGAEAQFNAPQFQFGSVSFEPQVTGARVVSIVMDTATTLDLSGVDIQGTVGPGDGFKIAGDNDAETITGSNIADTIAGGLGFDTAVYSGNRAAYTVTRSGAIVTVNGPDGPDGPDTLTGVERLQFADSFMSLRTETDFNGDGKSDVLFSNQGTVFASNYEWQLNNRSLLSEGAVDLYDKAFTVQVVGDYDGDGKSDVLFQNPATGGVWEWRLDGRTIVSQGAVDVGDPSFHLLGTGDLNGDGKEDLLFRNNAGFVYEWQMNGRVNTPQPVGPLDPKWHVQGTGDFNADGKDDILLHYKNASNAADPANGAFVVWQMNGKVIESTLGIERPDQSWQTLGIGDFNGDGIDDFAIRNVSNSGDNGAVWVYLLAGTVTNHGDGSKTLDILAQGAAGIADPATWHLQQVGDLDGDGRDDILYRNDAGFFYSWNMNGTTIASEGLLQGAAQWADPSFAVVKAHWDLV